MNMRKYDQSFIERFNHVLNGVNETVVEYRASSPWLVDQDVIEVYKTLAATMKTLASGIYYETLPDGSVRLGLFRALKTLFEQLMQPDIASEHPILKASEAVEVLEFLGFAAGVNTSVRPRSRRYLDWISETFGYAQPDQSSRLILP
jgi:hypothetical protein